MCSPHQMRLGAVVGEQRSGLSSPTEQGLVVAATEVLHGHEGFR